MRKKPLIIIAIIILITLLLALNKHNKNEELSEYYIPEFQSLVNKIYTADPSITTSSSATPTIYINLSQMNPIIEEIITLIIKLDNNTKIHIEIIIANKTLMSKLGLNVRETTVQIWLVENDTYYSYFDENQKPHILQYIKDIAIKPKDIEITLKEEYRTIEVEGSIEEAVYIAYSPANPNMLYTYTYQINIKNKRVELGYATINLAQSLENLSH